MGAILSNFHIFRPENEMEQDQISFWLAKLQSKATPQTFDERMLKKFSVKREYISKRSFFISDIGNFNFQKNELFNEKNQFMPGLSQRSQFYQKKIEQVFESFFHGEVNPPGEILHVSCTGYVSPSAGQKIIPKKNWSAITGLTHLYHMGCYAAIPAIKVAKGMADKKRIDIVHTEMCSLHFDVTAQTPEQTVVQTLFSDGAIKYSVHPEHSPEGSGHGMTLIKIKELIIPDSENAMTWAFGNNNLEMALHRTVPGLIRRNLKPFAENLFKECGLDFKRDKGNTIFAIHPGGPKIIEQVMGILDLSLAQVKYSMEVLKERGNMSSATMPHIWKKIIEDHSVKKGTKIFSVAFGPGLTVAGCIGIKK